MERPFKKLYIESLLAKPKKKKKMIDHFSRITLKKIKKIHFEKIKKKPLTLLSFFLL